MPCKALKALWKPAFEAWEGLGSLGKPWEGLGQTLRLCSFTAGTPFWLIGIPFWEDTLLEANCILEANCLLNVKPFREAKSIGFRVSGLLFGALRAGCS